MDFGFLAQGEEAGWAPAKATYGCSSRWLGRYSTTIGSLWFDLPDACAAASEIARRGLAVRAKLKDVFPVYDEGWRARLGKDVPLPAEVQGWVDVHRGLKAAKDFGLRRPHPEMTSPDPGSPAVWPGIAVRRLSRRRRPGLVARPVGAGRLQRNNQVIRGRHPVPSEFRSGDSTPDNCPVVKAKKYAESDSVPTFLACAMPVQLDTGAHPDWLREHVPGAAGATVQSVLVTPAKKAKQGAVPHLGRVSHWDLADFRAWADKAIDVVRELRRTFVEPGDLAWRAEAAARLEEACADAPGLARWLSDRPAREHLKSVS